MSTPFGVDTLTFDAAVVEMKWKNQSYEINVQLVDPHSGHAYPEVTNEGKTYVIGSPGASFEIECCGNALKRYRQTSEPVLMEMCIDGKLLSYIDTSFDGMPVVFPGWKTAADFFEFRHLSLLHPMQLPWMKLVTQVRAQWK
eukprot:jgi/Chlat1/3625/Chrsp237S08817